MDCQPQKEDRTLRRRRSNTSFTRIDKVDKTLSALRYTYLTFKLTLHLKMSNSSQNDNQDVNLSNLEDSSSSEENEKMAAKAQVTYGKNSVTHSDIDSAGCEDQNYEMNILHKIASIRNEVRGIEKEIMTLPINEIRANFRKFEEILIQNTITLDSIETKCNKNIRESRKNTILYIQHCLRTIDNILNNE